MRRLVGFTLQFTIMWKSKKKFKVLKEWLWIDYYSLDNALFEQNLLMERLRAENIELREDNERLENEINSPKNIWKLIENCAILSFFCLMWAWLLCIWFMMITDAIMWFKFVVFL